DRLGLRRGAVAPGLVRDRAEADRRDRAAGADVERDRNRLRAAGAAIDAAQLGRRRARRAVGHVAGRRRGIELERDLDQRLAPLRRRELELARPLEQAALGLPAAEIARRYLGPLDPSLHVDAHDEADAAAEVALGPRVLQVAGVQLGALLVEHLLDRDAV